MRPVRALVVDDEPVLLRMLDAALRGEGYEVILASDGRTALEQIDRAHPDVVLLDVMLPLVDGWTVLEALREDAERPRIVCLTAKDAFRDRVRGWRLGVDEYVTKPVAVDELLETVSDVVTRSSDRRVARRLEALRELGVPLG